MTRILNVDFKHKKLEYVWTEVGQDERDQKVLELYKTLVHAYDQVLNLEPQDQTYLDYCNTVFTGIVSNLRNR